MDDSTIITLTFQLEWNKSANRTISFGELKSIIPNSVITLCVLDTDLTELTIYQFTHEDWDECILIARDYIAIETSSKTNCDGLLIQQTESASEAARIYPEENSEKLKVPSSRINGIYERYFDIKS